MSKPTVHVGQPRAIAIVAALVGGSAIALSQPPFGPWPLALVGVALIYAASTDARVAWRGCLGLVAGIAQFAIGCAFVWPFSVVGYFALVPMQACFFGIGLALVPRGQLRPLGFVAAFSLAESARDIWPFGGLPIAGVALGQPGGPLAYFARLGGPVAITVVVAIVGVAFGHAALCFRKGPSRETTYQRAGVCLGVVLLVFLGSIGARDLDNGGSPIRAVEVAVVQGGGARGTSALEVSSSIAYVHDMSVTQSIDKRVDVVVWPEDTLGLIGVFASSRYAKTFENLARTMHATIVFGLTDELTTTRFHNVVVAISPTGRIIDSIEKVHAVPFGEYIPLRELIAHVANLSAVPRDMVTGHNSGLLTSPAGRFGLMISYETFYANRARSGVRAGGQALIVATNTASYASAQIPAQEIAASRIDAIATGRDLAQSASVGYSAFIDANGNVTRQTGLGASAYRIGAIELRRGMTIYDEVGEAPIFAVLGAVVVGLWADATRRRFSSRRSRRRLGPRPYGGDSCGT